MTALALPEGSNSLVKKHLSRKILTRLEHRKTDSGFTLAKAIRSGIKNPDSSIGIYAGDAQSYHTLSPLLDPIISEYHGFSKTCPHTSDITPIALPLIDPEGSYIRSTRIRVARNLKGFSFPCHMTLSQRKELEQNILVALRGLKDDLKGKYVSFEQMDDTAFQRLKKEGLTFEKGDRFQEAAGMNADFPKCRGVFHSDNNQLLAWVNEEDHLRIISLEKTSDISTVYNRLCRALPALNSRLDFAWDKTYGYLTSCPTNIGTAMRAGVHIRLERLASKKNLLQVLARRWNLQIRGTRGEKTRVENAIFDISNRQRLGISEFGIIQNLYKGLLAIIAAEKNL
ncbi:phosphagen kinase [Desulfobacula sp.]|uniref:phosphagen kinase n=1 Tax=Desulfobacula sp. TaxID=2593537 RepID=UPI00261BFC17|nr:phosphagen kinase [Desulfobacula sp.]